MLNRTIGRREMLKISGFVFLSIWAVALLWPPETKAQTQQLVVLVDDFQPQPIQGMSEWFYSRLDGDRGSIIPQGAGTVVFGKGFVTAQITNGSNTFVGGFYPLQHTQREGLPLNFSALFPAEIIPQLQGMVTGIRVTVQDGSGVLRVEVQAPNGSFPWGESVSLQGGPQVLEFTLPPLGDVQNINWTVQGGVGNHVTISRIELLVQVPQLPLAGRAFLWSFAMLLSNLDRTTGLARDRSGFAAGEFDATSVSGSLAGTLVEAWQLGIVSKSSADHLVNLLTDGLLTLPRMHGVLPHFVAQGVIKPGTEYSSVDTCLAVVPLILAREALDLDRARTAQLEQLLLGIDWQRLTLPDGSISHGFDESGQLLPFGWRDFGTETWLVNLALAAATGRVGPMNPPPTANGSAFIPHMAWQFLPRPKRPDFYGIWWPLVEEVAAARQVFYYRDGCYPGKNLFGLSAAEVPDPSAVDPAAIYQAFGIGGSASPPNDGSSLLGNPVIVPHAIAMIAALRPFAGLVAWSRVEASGVFTPLNNVESFMLTGEACEMITWNALKGSWNLSLQTLGWGRYVLLGRNTLQQALAKNAFLLGGYLLLAPRG